MLRFLNNIRAVFAATAIVVLMHIAALVSLIKLALEKAFEYIFKLLLLIIFIFLLVALSAFDPRHTQSWNNIKETWDSFIGFLLYFDYQDLMQWYKNVFSKDEKEAEIDS